MPNHLRNIIKFECDDQDYLDKMFESIKQDSESPKLRTIDFNKIIPMPNALNLETSSNTQKGLRLYLTKISPEVSYYGNESDKTSKTLSDALYNLAKRRLIWGNNELILNKDEIKAIQDSKYEDKLLSLGEKAANNLVEYGHITWYTWRVDKWNTKWNAYDFDEGNKNTLEFSTAWEPPIPVIQELSKQYPYLTINHYYSDECLGYNTGHMIYKDGNVRLDEMCEDFSKRAIDISLYVHHETPSQNDILPSYDNSGYIEKSTEYSKFTVNNELCIGSLQRALLSDIPAGFYTYFIVKDKLCNFYSPNQTGYILSNVPFECNSYGLCDISTKDIIDDHETISIEEFEVLGNELILTEEDLDFDD